MHIVPEQRRNASRSDSEMDILNNNGSSPDTSKMDSAQLELYIASQCGGQEAGSESLALSLDMRYLNDGVVPSELRRTISSHNR